MNHCTEIVIALMAMVAAVASAIAAWKAHSIANESFRLKKSISKYQDEILVLKETRADLVQIKESWTVIQR